ncbi:MAG: hypothetical protein RL198_112 [Actinomycetota bacterium]
MEATYRPIRVALLGAGSVGSQVARLLTEQADELRLRVGAELQLVGVAVRSVDSARDWTIPAELLTTDAESLILGADIVVELVGGIHPALDWIELALSSGADVVTANKALIADHGPRLAELADRFGAQLNFEAAVAGAIPIIRPLRESLAGDNILRVMGIVNGSTNFILDRMESQGGELSEAMAIASQLGYLEADPTLDVEGFDAAAKAAILASLAFHTEVSIEQVYREGILSVTREQIQSARESGYTVKLLAICERMTDATGQTGITVRVHPALIPAKHPLAAVRLAFNAVFVEAESAGQLMFYGAGAGGVQTASAVLGDLVSVAKRHLAGGPGLSDSSHARLSVFGIDQVRTRYQIALEVSDLPGVLAGLAGVFADFGVSVEAVHQTPADSQSGGRAKLRIMTHEAREADLAAVVGALQEHNAVHSVVSVIRVEGL